MVVLKLKLKTNLQSAIKLNVCKDTEALATLQLTTVFKSNSKQMCLESTTECRQCNFIIHMSNFSHYIFVGLFSR